MAITGTGTQADPYIVTTYAELVEKAAESGVFVKIGNDINITDEYPNGNMPSLEVRAVIDGDGRSISNWYRSVWVDGAPIVLRSSVARLNYLKIRNIYMKYPTGFIYAPTDTNDEYEYFFNNCEFSGVINGDFAGSDYNYARRFYNRCSLYLKNIGEYSSNSGSLNGTFLSCYIKYHITKRIIVFEQGSIIDSYIEITADDEARNNSPFSRVGITLSNCVIDSYLTTEQSMYSSGEMSIINSTHAPNYTLYNSSDNHLALVDDSRWLDTEYLASIGFNAG